MVKLKIKSFKDKYACFSNFYICEDKLKYEEDYSVLETYYYFPTTENIFDSLESSYISEEQVQDIRSGLEVKTQNETFKLVKISDD